MIVKCLNCRAMAYFSVISQSATADETRKAAVKITCFRVEIRTEYRAVILITKECLL
jgi:hypothetical protein